jgi:glycerophosphoryl diester phosphodiesterase
MHRTARGVIVRVTLRGVILLATSGAASRADDSPPAHARVAGQGVLVIAHRGASKVAPENTLPAFRAAIDAAADLVELDYHHSADDVPVVIHDKDLDRTTDSAALWGQIKIKVAEKKLAELKRLDAGTWFDPKFAGTRLPTLDESLDAISAGSMTLVERKAGDAETCVALLRRKMLLDNVVVQAFDWKFLTRCHALAPKLVTGALGEKQLTAEKLDEIAATGATVVGWEDKYTDRASIAAIHARGWKAWVWTVDDPQRARELVQAGVDAIITNAPAEIRKAIEADVMARSKAR